MTTTKYYNFNGFNDKTGDFETNKYVIVNNETGRYVEVGNGAGPSATKSVDFQGKYLMPGLINAHIHVDSDVYNEFGKPNFGVNNEQEHVRAVKK